MSSSLASFVASAPEMTEFPGLFEGPEKTVTLCFKPRRVAGGSLRLITREAWSEVLKHAKCEILSVVESSPPIVAPSKAKDKKVLASKGVTAYLLSESSLFVSDNSVVLKTCGRTTPLRALEPILDLAVPSWRSKDPEHYMKYATFTRLGYMRPDEQLEPHVSWPQEVVYMDKYFGGRGEFVVLGSEASSMQHVYVANYLPQGEIIDAFSTQVALTNLDTTESMRRYGQKCNRTEEDQKPLADSWSNLHGSERRSSAARPVLDECFFQPIGYSANGVFGKHFTTVHITPQPGCSYLSMETSLPLNREARQSFAEGTLKWCASDTVAITEFSLSPNLLGGAAPQLYGYELQCSTQSIRQSFACAHHHYHRCLAKDLPPRMPPAGSAIEPSEDIETTSHVELEVAIQEPEAAAVAAAECALAQRDQCLVAS